jgi:hypothetical protein
LSRYLALVCLPSGIRSYRQAQRLSLSLPPCVVAASGAETQPICRRRPRWSPNHTGGPRVVQPQGLTSLDLTCEFSTPADGAIVRSRASVTARFGLIDRSVERSPCALRSDRPKPACSERLGGGPARGDILQWPRPCPGTDR